MGDLDKEKFFFISFLLNFQLESFPDTQLGCPQDLSLPNTCSETVFTRNPYLSVMSTVPCNMQIDLNLLESASWNTCVLYFGSIYIFCNWIYVSGITGYGFPSPMVNFHWVLSTAFTMIGYLESWLTYCLSVYEPVDIWIQLGESNNSSLRWTEIALLTQVYQFSLLSFVELT